MLSGLKDIKIVYNSEISGAEDFALKVASAFFEAGLTDKKSEIFALDKMPDKAGFVVVIGGDGTLLRCARNYGRINVPVFGFNMGRLGYLSQAMPDDINHVVEKLKSGDFRIEERLMLVSSAGNVALNDMVIRKETNARTAVLNLFINDKPICSYMADGIIIATPTGSTAYSMSAGGPVISPDIDCFVVVAICPHTLTARPVIVNPEDRLVIRICEKSNCQITADGQDTRKFTEEVEVKKFENRAKLLLLNKNRSEFYGILREKLHWGVAPHKC